MDQQNPTLAKIPILDTGKFEQWQFRIQQYLQHEHYALSEVIEFGDSYEVPASATRTATTDTTSDGTGKKKGRTVTVTTEDMQKRKNDVKARTTLLLSLPDEHQLQFITDKEDPIEFSLMANTSAENKTGLPEFKDDTVTDYSRPAPTVESSPDDAQNRNPSVTETEASPSTISPKSFIKFVKENDSPIKSKTYKAKIAKKPHVKYAEQYRKPTKKPNVRGNQRNLINLKSHQLGPNFVMKKNHALTVVILTILLMNVEKG
nr:hypothetical protein [Tanacetum cinerariifolium]